MSQYYNEIYHQRNLLKREKMGKERSHRQKRWHRSTSMDETLLSSPESSSDPDTGSSLPKSVSVQGQRAGNHADVIPEHSNRTTYRVEDDVENFRLFSRPRTIVLLCISVLLVFCTAIARSDPSYDWFGIYRSERGAAAGAGVNASLSAVSGESIGESGVKVTIAKDKADPSLNPESISQWKPEGEMWQDNMFAGFKAVCFMILVISAVSFPDGPFTRPHPLLWRLVLGLILIYWSVLIFVLFLDYQQVRFILAWLYPKDLMPERYGANTPLPWVTVSFLDSPDYATDCSVTWENVASRYLIYVARTCDRRPCLILCLHMFTVPVPHSSRRCDLFRTGSTYLSCATS